MFTRIFVGLVLLTLGILSPCTAEEFVPPAVSMNDLLKPEMFPDAQFGMKVDSAVDGDKAVVITTGGKFVIDKKANLIECGQRIAKERSVATIKLPGSIEAVKLTHSTSGGAIFSDGSTTIRINCDSLVMISPGVDGDITAELSFVPDYHREFFSNFNFFDPYGGISFFTAILHPGSDWYACENPVRIVWHWKAGDVLWAGVSPPKGYDWKKSVEDRMISYGTSVDRYMYPSLLELKYYRMAGFTTLQLHNEEMWEHWQLSLVPRDQENYKRFMRDAKEAGIRVCVYASPYFFLGGSREVHRASPDSHVGWGEFTGEGAFEYVRQAKRLVEEFDTPGLYFDELYSSRTAIPAQYYVARTCRGLIGDANPLMLHPTTDTLGDGHTGVWCPALHAYFDYIYKGEGEEGRREKAYTRYVLSSYNLSNSIGMQNLEDRSTIVFEHDPQWHMEYWLKQANVRFWIRTAVLMSPWVESYRTYYWPRLNEGLKAEIEPELLKPVGAFAEFRKSINRMQQRTIQ